MLHILKKNGLGQDVDSGNTDVHVLNSTEFPQTMFTRYFEVMGQCAVLQEPFTVHHVHVLDVTTDLCS